MKTTDSVRVPARRRFPPAPLVFAAGVAVASVGAGLAWQGTASHEAATPARVTHAAPTAGAEDWRFVLGSPVVDVLRHRQGLAPADVVRTSAFGCDGLTVREVRHDPVLVRVLRFFPTLSPRDLVRMEARGS